MGIEPTWPAWKASALPLSYTRDTLRDTIPNVAAPLISRSFLPAPLLGANKGLVGNGLPHRRMCPLLPFILRSYILMATDAMRRSTLDQL